MVCPVCGNVVRRIYFSGPLGMEEEYIVCKTCNYEYVFQYGHSVEFIANKAFVEHYYDTPDRKRRISKQSKKTLFMARRRWRKHHKGLTYPRDKFPV